MRRRKKIANRLSSDVDMMILDSLDVNGTASLRMDEDWSRASTSFDILLVNGLMTDNSSVLRMWGFHPENPWWEKDLEGGHGYLLQWESEVLTKITTLLMDTAV